MKKLAVAILLAAITLPAWAGVKLNNKTGEKVDLKVKGSSTVTRSLDSSTNTEVGGSASSITIIVKVSGSEVCEGTFSNGDKVVIEKSGSSYSIKKD